MNNKIDYDKLNSLQLFWHFPGEWWQRRHWIARLFWATIFIAMIAATAIAMYDAASMREVKRLNEIQRQQIGELAKVIDAVKGERKEALTNKDDKVWGEIVDLQEQLINLQEQAIGLNNQEFNDSVEDALAALEASESAETF